MKKIAAINDMSGFGRCSLTAALPVISALGVECCPLPTAILSNQTGYDSFFCQDFTEHIPAYVEQWRKRDAHFDGIVTGFLMCPEQAEDVLKFVREFKTADTLYICDPVMADDGQLYSTYTTALCEKIEQLLSMADLITPNLTELCVLSHTPYAEVLKAEHPIEKIEELARALLHGSLQTVVVTGILQQDHITNLIVTREKSVPISSKRYGDSYSGTGDLFVSVLAGLLVQGYSIIEAVECATEFLAKSIESAFLACNNRNDGVDFQKYLSILTEKVVQK